MNYLFHNLTKRRRFDLLQPFDCFLNEFFCFLLRNLTFQKELPSTYNTQISMREGLYVC